MIGSPVEFDASEAALIEQEVRRATFSSEAWSCEVFTSVKKKIKDHYVRAQNFRCCYCQKEFPTKHGRAWDIEHVISRSVNCKFMFESKNLAAACIECNQNKSAVIVTVKAYKKFPTNSDQYLIVHPHFDEWGDHITKLGVDIYQPKTKKGKFTIFHCDLFRFWEMKAKLSRKIRDARFERDLDELREAESEAEATPIVASILARIRIDRLNKCPVVGDEIESSLSSEGAPRTDTQSQ